MKQAVNFYKEQNLKKMKLRNELLALRKNQ